MSTQPSCFGKRWDPNHVECKGGLDAAYQNPRDQTHRRDRCSWFNSCSQAMNYQPISTAQPTPQPAPTQQIIPARSLLHRPAVDTPPPRPSYQPPLPPFTPPRPPTQIPAHQPSYTPQYAPPQHYATVPPPQPVPQYAPMPAHQMMVHPAVAQYGPPLVYQPYQNPGMQMPQYLTVPEPVEGISWGARLGHELTRSLGKAFGHTLAAYFDSNPFRRHNSQ